MSGVYSRNPNIDSNLFSSLLGNQDQHLSPEKLLEDYELRSQGTKRSSKHLQQAGRSLMLDNYDLRKSFPAILNSELNQPSKLPTLKHYYDELNGLYPLLDVLETPRPPKVEKPSPPFREPKTLQPPPELPKQIVEPVAASLLPQQPPPPLYNFPQPPSPFFYPQIAPMNYYQQFHLPPVPYQFQRTYGDGFQREKRKDEDKRYESLMRELESQKEYIKKLTKKIEKRKNGKESFHQEEDSELKNYRRLEEKYFQIENEGQMKAKINKMQEQINMMSNMLQFQALQQMNLVSANTKPQGPPQIPGMGMGLPFS